MSSSSSVSAFNILEFSPEIILNISSVMPVDDRVRASGVCHLFHEYFRDDLSWIEFYKTIEPNYIVREGYGEIIDRINGICSQAVAPEAPGDSKYVNLTAEKLKRLIDEIKKDDIIKIWENLGAGQVLWNSEEGERLMDEKPDFSQLRSKSFEEVNSAFTVWIDACKDFVTALYLDNLSLRYLPQQIGLLVNLKELSLSGNLLTFVPAFIGNLIQLRELNVDNNKLRTLPDELSSCSLLRDLEACNNQFTESPRVIGSLINLRFVDLASNQLTEVPREIFSLTKLRVLNLSDNQLESLPEDEEEWKKLRKLKEINLRNNNRLTNVAVLYGCSETLKIEFDEPEGDADSSSCSEHSCDADGAVSDSTVRKRKR